MASDKRYEDNLKELKEFACEMQQCYYECLLDCTKYEPNEHKYLIQNIGYAIFGAPKNKNDKKENETTEKEKCDTSTKENKSESTTESNDYSKLENSNNADADIADIIDYNKDEKPIIDKIYKKICECVIEQNNSQSIYCGIIYNIIISKKKDYPKQQADKKKENEIEKTDITEKNNLPISNCPIFTIRKNIQKQSNTTETAEQKVLTNNEMSYETWYLDTSARVYKNWSDYKNCNTIPECIMILPKDGCYQADERQPITEDYSTVWLEIIDSPACSLQKKLCNGLDIASTVVGIGGIGLSVASMFTPIGPVVGAAGLLANGVTGAWCIGRSTQTLIDRNKHEEPINPLNIEAFPHWLGLAGSATGFGVMGGSRALSMAAARGMTVNIAARTAFNAVQCSSVLINGVGIFYQGYCIVDRYRTEKSFNLVDTLNFVMHALFFTNSVINIQFAHNIIETTQGNIVKDYKQKLRSKNLRKKFNRFIRKANQNNTNKISENAEVICYIKNREQLQLSQKGTIDIQKSEKNSFKVAWTFEKDIVKINNIPLINPLEYVARLIKRGIFDENDQNDQFHAQNNASNFDFDNTSDDIFKDLMKMFHDLIKKFYANDYPTNMIMPYFEPLLREISSMNISEHCVKVLFEITIRLIKNCRDTKDILPIAMKFIWQYCKENLKQWGIRTSLRMQSESGSHILQKIIIVVSEASEMFDNLFDAWLTYMEARGTTYNSD